MEQIDKFNEAVGQILGALFEVFPRRIRIENKNLCGFHSYTAQSGVAGRYTGKWEDKSTGDVVTIAQDDLEFQGDTLWWLIEFDFIVGKHYPWGVEVATLTPRGLAMMNTSVAGSGDALAEQSTYGKNLIKALAAKTKDTVAEMTGTVLAVFTKEMLKP